MTPKLALNSGSSSLKFALYEVHEDRGERLTISGELSQIGQPSGEVVVRDAADQPLIE